MPSSTIPFVPSLAPLAPLAVPPAPAHVHEAALHALLEGQEPVAVLEAAAPGWQPSRRVPVPVPVLQPRVLAVQEGEGGAQLQRQPRLLRRLRLPWKTP